MGMDTSLSVSVKDNKEEEQEKHFFHMPNIRRSSFFKKSVFNKIKSSEDIGGVEPHPIVGHER